MNRVIFCLATSILVFAHSVAVAQDRVAAPRGKELKRVVTVYLKADVDTRRTMRAEADKKYSPLKDGPELKSLRKEMLAIAKKTGPKLKGSGTMYFYDKKAKKQGKYIVRGRPQETLFIGLHGGGKGSGDAGNMAGAMGGGGWWWIFPEVLEKTEYGWTTSGTEEFVMDLIEAAKRTGKVDPDRIFITGHSMGGFGSWTLGAHHADVFAGAAPYAGAPTPIWEGSKAVAIAPGVIPNLYNLRLHFFQSLDDKNVPAAANEQASKELKVWKKDYPEGFDYRYLRVNGRGHAAPKKGYMPTQKWVASKNRNARPKKILWQPKLKWKRHFYWLYWDAPILDAIIEASTNGKNEIEINTVEGYKELKGITVLLGDPIADLSKEIEIKVDGVSKFNGKVERTFSTLLLTIPRNDPKLLFDARVDL
ncbi:MAG: putative esterase [Planctomycetota bacterium]|jgi:predicted esterase